MTSDPDEDRDDGNEEDSTQLDILTAATEAAANMVAVYSRTEGDTKQSIEELLTHTEQALGYEYSDTGRESLVTHPDHTGPEEHAVGINPESGYDGCAVIYDEDSTHPAGVERLIKFSGEHEVDDVVAESLAAFGGVDESTRVVERLQDEDVTVHLIEDDLTVSPSDDHARKLLTAARRASRVDTDADASQLVTEAINANGWTGRPPLGFTVGPTGQLRRLDRWDEIRNVVKTLDDGLITEYRASQLLDCSRDAIRNAKSKYRDLYRLDAPDIDATADAEQ